MTSNHAPSPAGTGTSGDAAAQLRLELLQTTLPVVPGLDVAVSCRPATESAAAGDAWYDAAVFPDGRVAMVVGAVAGAGFRTVAAMGQLRAVAMERLLFHGDPRLAAKALDEYGRRAPAAFGASACLAIVDLEKQVVNYSTCGHPAPLIISESDPAGQALPATGGGPLGTGVLPELGTAALSTDEVLLLFSNGVLGAPVGAKSRHATWVETAVRTMSEVAGEGRLHSVAQRLCHRLLERLTLTDGDGAVLLAAQPRHPIQPLELTLAARRDLLGGVRDAVQRWARSLHLGVRDEYAIECAVGEAAANVVDHAYSSEVGMVSIRADLDRCGSVHLSVTDEGSWVAPGSLSDSRGVGLALIQDVTDKLAIKHHDKGTTVLMSRRLGRDSDVVTGPVGICGAGGRTRAGEFSFRFSENPPTVALSGRIDNDCDTELEAALQRYSTAGLQSITVDLSEVTQLVATAVSVLHRFAQRSPRSTFVVRRGRPAAEILVPSGLPRLEIIDGRA